VQVSISPSKDNTLYELQSGDASNGAGEYMFTGRTKDGFIRRAVIHFNVPAAIPAGATINSVTLQMRASRVSNQTIRTETLYRLLADWGEGTSNAAQNEGQGAAPTTNDATWHHRFYPGTLWTTQGGDFTASATASVSVGGTGVYTWTGGSLVSDVQAWLNTPSTNFGWIVRGDETTTETAKRFDSRQNTTVGNRPILIVDYTSTAVTGACCYGDTCEVLTPTACATLSGTYQGDGTICTPDPCATAGVLDSVIVVASKDNTLYEDAVGSLSNGAGTKFIVSRSTAIRRGVLAFNLAPSVPPGAVVSSATLTLYNVQTGTNATNVSLYRATADWGEGTSLATGTEDAGAPSTAGDATWIHRFYPGTSWTAAGGDFNATATAVVSVGNEGSYTWSGLAGDVQSWLDTPSSNFGWVIRGREQSGGSALKRFESRQSTDPTRRPQLKIVYTAPSVPTGACCLTDGTCDTLSAAQCSAAGGTYQGDGTVCVPENLCPLILTPFVDPLPIPAVATPVTGTVGGVAKYVIPATEQSQKYHRDLPPTRVWGYAGTYPGPTIVASRDKEVTVQWVNDLRDSTGALRTTHYLPVDPCVHGADMAGPTPRVVTHLHGGHVEMQSDGYPTSTMLPGQSQTYHYPNHQVPGTLWYHDHALGITRLNVMMGLAGFYLLVDSVETALGLPSGPYEIGLAVQDRTLRPNGSIVYPALWQEHFFGDKAVVNGKVWPYLNVDRGKYRFRMLDGSTSRTYTFHLSNGAPLQVIGTDGGMLPAPVTVDSLTLTPGERADVIMDFAGYAAGTEIILTNTAPAPFPSGMSGEPALPQIMKFIVQASSGHTAPIPGSLRPVTYLPEVQASRSRDLILSKQAGGPCGSEWLINGLHFDDVTEFPVLDSTEIWRFINRSGVTHPMHMHLTMFQILDRQAFTVSNGNIIPVGSPIPPGPEEHGWKDTAAVPPNMMVRVITKFEDYVGRYPYHCHILEHEENEMMRQFQVVHAPITAVTPASPRYRLALERSRPNPFNPETRIDYELPSPASVRLEVFDVSGRLVAILEDGPKTAGRHYAVWNGKNGQAEPQASGVYVYRLVVDGVGSLSRKMTLLK
jgi:spore coat protein A